MHISGTESSSVNISQTRLFQKMESVVPKVSKQAEAKRDGVINPRNYNFKYFWHGKFWCSQNDKNKPKSTVELGYMCPRVLTSPPAVTRTK